MYNKLNLYSKWQKYKLQITLQNQKEKDQEFILKQKTP
jgi:hypothetical protein